ncbi:MAG: efflux RND transporter periplasmic adaptor subunit [Eubacteriales bacterium]
MAFNLSKKQRKLVLAGGVGIILIGLLGWYFLGSRGSSQVATATVAVKKESIEVTVSANGAVVPVATRNITSKVSGTITSIGFSNGQQVKKGDLLFELDSSSVQAEVTKAQLDLRQAELDMGTTGQEIEDQQVYSPISGQVTSIQVSKGQDVQKGSALMTVQDTSSLILVIPFTDVGNIKIGQKADVTIPDLSLAVLPGWVKKVDRGGKADPDGTRLYNVTVAVANPGGLAPGVKGQAVVHTKQGTEYGYGLGPFDWAEIRTVTAGVSGTVQYLFIDENSNVKKGQRLASVNSDTLNVQKNSQSLKLQQSRLGIANIEKQLTDYKIYAPVNGILSFNQTGTGDTSTGSSNSSASEVQNGPLVGDEVKPGQVLAIIDGTSGMSVTVPVDEVDIAKVKIGQKANVTIDALPDSKFGGTVTEVGNQGIVQNNVANFDVTVLLDEANGLKPGMTANVEILVNRKDQALVVPIEAVQERQGKKFVMLATGKNTSQQKNAGARQGALRPVETGLYNETNIEITSGLSEGDKVVLPTVVRSSGTNGNRGGVGGGGGFGGLH